MVSKKYQKSTTDPRVLAVKDCLRAAVQRIYDRYGIRVHAMCIDGDIEKQDSLGALRMTYTDTITEEAQHSSGK